LAVTVSVICRMNVRISQRDCPETMACKGLKNYPRT
jgi:hypothetical protein